MQDESPNEHELETLPTVHLTVGDVKQGLQKLLDEQGYLVMWSFFPKRIGEVIDGISLYPSGDFHPDIKIVVCGTATMEDWLAQERRLAHWEEVTYWTSVELPRPLSFWKVTAE